MSKVGTMTVIRMMRIDFSIQRRYRWAGMVSQFRIGCISCMDWPLSINVRFVEIIRIGGEEHTKSIFKNGDMQEV